MSITVEGVGWSVTCGERTFAGVVTTRRPSPSPHQCGYCCGQGKLLERFDRFGPLMLIVCRWCDGKRIL